MKCADVRTMAESYLAGELPVDTSHAIIAHLEGCASCQTELHARVALRQTLREAFRTSADLAPHPRFTNQVLRGVRSERAGAARRSLKPGHWLAIAATAALLILAAWQIVGMKRPSGHLAGLIELVAHATGDHRDCALHHALEEAPISLEEAALRYGPVYASLRTAVADSALVRSGDVEVLGAHSCVFEGRRFAHVVVRRRGHVVSILLTPIDWAQSVEPTHADVCPSSDGFRVACFSARGHAGFVVSDLSDEENLALAHELAPLLQAYLARA
jgi:anti-sigma factor RsiW